MADSYYRRDRATGYLADIYRTVGLGGALSDSEARSRLDEHRALTLSDNGTGLNRPQWLASAFAKYSRPSSILQALFPVVHIDRAAQLYIPKQDAPVEAETPAENVGFAGGDEFDASFDVENPVYVYAAQDASRQLLEGAGPLVDAILMPELQRSVAYKVEQVIVAAIHAASTAATSAGDFDAVADAAKTIRGARDGADPVLLLSDVGFDRTLRFADGTGGRHVASSSRLEGNGPIVGNATSKGVFASLPTFTTSALRPASGNDLVSVVDPAGVTVFLSDAEPFLMKSLRPETVRLAFGIYAYAWVSDPAAVVNLSVAAV